MGTATYRLVERAARGFHFALVTVTADFAETTIISVSDQAFHWLIACYGPDAKGDTPWCETVRNEAISGAAPCGRRSACKVLDDFGEPRA